MVQKKLQKNSILNEYDLDGDDLITDEELERAKQIKETETKLRKNLAQLRMALSDISNLFYISGAGIVGTYMGTSAYMAKNGVK